MTKTSHPLMTPLNTALCVTGTYFKETERVGPDKSQVKRQVALTPKAHFPDTVRSCRYQPVKRKYSNKKWKLTQESNSSEVIVKVK